MAILILIAIVILLIIVGVYFVCRKSSVFSKIYLDNNGTTQPHKEVVKAMYDASYLGNASSSYAWDAKAILKGLKSKIRTWAGVENYHVILTSGASESNNLVIRSYVDKWYRERTDRSSEKPHIILSSIEHKTSIECVKQLNEENRATYTLVEPDIYGMVHVGDVIAAITEQTQLVSIMSANNETGTIMPIKEIAEAVRSRGIPFHTDAVQTFGKYSLKMEEHGITAASMSFHKMNGPLGIGALIIKKDSGIKSQIAGSQNDKLRGGTQNVPAAAGALKAMEITLADRNKKNEKMRLMKTTISEYLRDSFYVENYSKLSGLTDEDALAKMAHRLVWTNNIGPKKPLKTIMFLGPVDDLNMPDNNNIPNTLLFSVINRQQGETPASETNHAEYMKLYPYEKFCNIKLKSDLAAEGAIVSIGSACNTGETGASHVLHAIGAPFIVRCGVVRVSLGDYNTIREVESFCKKLKTAILNQ